MIESKRAAAVPVTARMVEFLRDLSSASRKRVRDITSYDEVLWLDDLPAQVTPFFDATNDDVLFSFDAVPSEPAPAVPAILQGWVDVQDTLSSDGDEPELAERGSISSENMAPDDRGYFATLYGLESRWTHATVEAEDAPRELLTAWRVYLQTWQQWAEQDRHMAAERHWYGRLSRIAHLLTQQDDRLELVIATGLLSWLTPAGDRLRNHLLTTRAVATIDPDTGRVDVSVASEGSTRMQDRDVLYGQQGYDPVAGEPVRQELRQVAPIPLGDQIKDQLEKWRALSLARCHPYRHDITPQPAPTSGIELRFAPALVLRERDRSSLIDYYDQMLEALSGPDASAPLGLAQLITSLEPEERLQWLDADGASPAHSIGTDPLFPLPANPEQAQIISRLRSDNGVVVQGPPGTGKTHTIANLVSALLARGQRVLVTSQKAQALRVLRDKMPDEIQQLCVSMTDLGRGGSQELSRSVNAMSERYASFQPERQDQLIHDIATRREAARREVAALSEQVRALREAETYQHPPIAAGYAGTLSNIVDQLTREEPSCGWMPLPMPENNVATPPLTAAEMNELRGLLATATSQRASRRQQSLPDVSTLPTTAVVDALVVAEAAAIGAAQTAQTPASEALADCPETVLAELRRIHQAGSAALSELNLPADPQAWPADDWRVRALTDVFGRRELAVWSDLAAMADQATAAQSALSLIGLRQISLPAFTASGPDSAPAQLTAGHALRTWLAGGGQLKRLLKPAIQKQAALLLEHATVDGIPPTSVELLDLVLAQVSSEVTASALARRWELVGVRIDPDYPLPRQVAQLGDTHRALSQVLATGKARDAAAAALSDAGVTIPLNSPAGWATLGQALQAVKMRNEARDATALLQAHVAQLEPPASHTHAPPELQDMVRALKARDGLGYEGARQALVDAHEQKQAQNRCDALRARLSAAHPGLAEELDTTSDDPAWSSRLATWNRAWAWGIARSFFDRQRRPGRERELELALSDVIARVEKNTAQLAAAQAWQHCLQRMTATQAMALRAYQQHISERGMGTGRYAGRYERAAREAMVHARGAVPAWIMPLPEVLETIPPERDSFDVVIIDEASQASLESMFLLWLAPRVIVVGDDRQCAPSAVAHGELQPIFDKLDQYLPDLPEYLRIAFTPNSSLFSLLATRFGSVIRLREHFRCMPEIIDWSSRVIYSDMPLVPLRQFGADRLPPLRVRYVPDAVTEGSATRLRNPAEAQAIVDQILACAADDAYRDKTFGVVVLQGTGQVQLITDLLHEHLPAEEWEHRRLRVGTPPDFQGDERNVIFLSLVLAERRTALTRRDWQRRFNVAATRAQDQMWLFHSVTADLLSPTDLRRSLLDYMRNPPAPQTRTALDDVRFDERHQAFDSLFEQRVFLRIRQRGYHVTPQVEVNGRRIDLVVTGAKGRLAVECDGDAFHSSPSQIADDLDRERELKRAGWKFWRVRESEFYFDPDAALHSLWADLDARGIHPNEVTGDDAPDDVSEWAPITLTDAEGLDGLDGANAAELDDVAPRLTGAVHAPATRRTTTTAGDRRSSLTTQAELDFSIRGSRSTNAVTTSDVRAWARREGLPVGSRGRLDPTIIALYNRVHPDSPFETPHN